LILILLIFDSFVKFIFLFNFTIQSKVYICPLIYFYFNFDPCYHDFYFFYGSFCIIIFFFNFILR
jgi:hypothetical protein